MEMCIHWRNSIATYGWLAEKEPVENLICWNCQGYGEEDSNTECQYCQVPLYRQHTYLKATCYGCKYKKRRDYYINRKNKNPWTSRQACKYCNKARREEGSIFCSEDCRTASANEIRGLVKI